MTAPKQIISLDFHSFRPQVGIPHALKRRKPLPSSKQSRNLQGQQPFTDARKRRYKDKSGVIRIVGEAVPAPPRRVSPQSLPSDTPGIPSSQPAEELSLEEWAALQPREDLLEPSTQSTNSGTHLAIDTELHLEETFISPLTPSSSSTVTSKQKTPQVLVYNSDSSISDSEDSPQQRRHPSIPLQETPLKVPDGDAPEIRFTLDGIHSFESSPAPDTHICGSVLSSDNEVMHSPPRNFQNFDYPSPPHPFTSLDYADGLNLFDELVMPMLAAEHSDSASDEESSVEFNGQPFDVTRFEFWPEEVVRFENQGLEWVISRLE